MSDYGAWASGGMVPPRRDDWLGPFRLDRIYQGDARKLGRYVPDSSVDLILCDPVYDKYEQYEWLALFGLRVLRPGGSVIAQVGNYHLFGAGLAMQKHLPQVWTLAEVYPFATSRVWERRIVQGWKPHLWFCKGKTTERSGSWVIDRFRGGGREKNGFEWQDSTAYSAYLIERLSPMGGVVCDPFSGTGTVASACKALGRRYLSFELDFGRAVASQERLRNEPEPLFVLEPQQLAFPEVAA